MPKTINHKLTIKNVDVNNKTVLVRVDYDVSVGKYYKIGATYRIDRTISTLNFLIKRGCRVIICSHLGRPKNGPENQFSLKRVALYLSSKLKRPVQFIEDPFSASAKKIVKSLQPGDVAMIENLRFWPGEEANDKVFAKKLVTLSGADFFVQDAFAVLQRKHASMDAITKYLPTVAGLLVVDEYKHLENLLQESPRPTLSIVGGAKIKDKLTAIDNLIDKCDEFLVGGAVANTIYRFNELYIGGSLIDESCREIANDIKVKIKAKEAAMGLDRKNLPRCRVRHSGQCLLCSQTFRIFWDVAVSVNKKPTQNRMTIESTMVADNEMILDIGDVAIMRMPMWVGKAKTIVWSGVIGYVELPYFSEGTKALTRYLAELTSAGKAKVYVGGGDTADFLYKFYDDPMQHFEYISTGGSAFLDLLAGKDLPGYDNILEKPVGADKKL